MHVIKKTQNQQQTNTHTHKKKQRPKLIQNKNTLSKNPTKMLTLSKKIWLKKEQKKYSPTRPHNQTLPNLEILLMYKVCHCLLLSTKENRACVISATDGFPHLSLLLNFC